MKKFSTLFLFLAVLSMAATAQVFWDENFGTGCNQGQIANGVTTAKGMWVVTFPTNNDPNANEWFISAKADGTGSGNCTDKNCTNSNQSLHVSSNDGVSTNDAYCNYDAGGLCSILSICVTTDARAESPVINCTGYSTITLTFNYIENGDGGISDYATCWYYNGSVWSQLAKLPSTSCCGGTCTGNNQGLWTSYSVALPASANNNPGVKLGFRWVNNDDGVGNDPSVAIDDIQLSTTSVAPPVAKITTADTTGGCTPVCVNFVDSSSGNPTSWLWTFKGAVPSSSTLQNPQGICYDTAGSFGVKLKVSNSSGTDSVTLSNYVVANPSPPTPTITQHGDSLLCSTDPSYTSYQWFDSLTSVNGATHSYYVIDHSGNFNVSVNNEYGCQIAVGITATFVGIPIYSAENEISLSPNPARNQLTIAGSWKSESGNWKLGIFNILGQSVFSRQLDAANRKQETINIASLPCGIYFLHLENSKGNWTKKFIKE